MKRVTLLVVSLLAMIVTSCASIYVTTDYDSQTDFSTYKTFAFFKEGVDKAEISDLDKKRILRAIEANFSQRGMTLSETPDILVHIFTRERENIDVYDNYSPYYWGWGIGYGPFWGGANYSVSRNSEGILYIEIIDAQKKELIWQGKGVGYLPQNRERKEEAIKNFVNKILEEYPNKNK